MNLNEFIKTEDDAKKALIGTILADGSISRERRGSRGSCEITHTMKNLDYLKVKKEAFEMISGIECKIKPHNKTTKEKTYYLYRLTTNNNDWCTQVRSLIYDSERIKLFPKECIDNLSDLGLFFMYLDDGSLKIRYHEGSSKIREIRTTFHLDCFTFDELKYFRDWLLEKHNIKTGVYRDNRRTKENRGFIIWTNTENSKRIMTLFDPFYNLIPSMQYKFVKYHSPS